MKSRTCGCLMVIVALQALYCQAPGGAAPAGAESKTGEKALDFVFDYLNMANRKKAADFRPLTQKERNELYGKSLVNPVWYLKGAFSAAQNQWKDKPAEWEQGTSGYGKRYADIMGQYAIQKTTTFGLESLLHEDNRYFGSRKKGFWPRTGYALSSSILARHDNGRRYPSVSSLTGYASGAFLSRLWQPPSSNTAGAGAVSFGISMGWNIGFSVVKEFLPDILRPFTK
jgi:hypothetical protein